MKTLREFFGCATKEDEDRRYWYLVDRIAELEKRVLQDILEKNEMKTRIEVMQEHLNEVRHKLLQVENSMPFVFSESKSTGAIFNLPFFSLHSEDSVKIEERN